MKQIKILVTIILMISLLTLTVSAAESTELTVEEAEKLIRGIDDFYHFTLDVPDGVIPERIDNGYGSALGYKPDFSIYDLIEKAEETFLSSTAVNIAFAPYTVHYINGELIFAEPGLQYLPFYVDGSEYFNDFSFDIELDAISPWCTDIYFNYLYLPSPMPEDAEIRRTHIKAFLEDGEWKLSGTYSGDGSYIDLIYELQYVDIYKEEIMIHQLRRAVDLYVSFYRASWSFTKPDLKVIDNPFPEYEDYPYIYYARDDEYRDWCTFTDAVYSVFSDELSEKFIFCAPVTDHHGQTFSCGILGHAQNEGIYLDYYNESIEDSVYLDLNFRIIEETENSVTAEFEIFDWVDGYKAKTYTAEYKKSGDNWRISGGSFFDSVIQMHSCSPNAENAPETGDDGFVLVLFAILSLIVIFIIKHRRERK